MKVSGEGSAHLGVGYGTGFRVTWSFKWQIYWYKAERTWWPGSVESTLWRDQALLQTATHHGALKGLSLPYGCFVYFYFYFIFTVGRLAVWSLTATAS